MLRRTRSTCLRRATLALIATCLPGCASWFVADADREVGIALQRYQQRVLGTRDSWVQYPIEQADPSSAASADSGESVNASAEAADGAGPEPALIDLRAALRQAFTASRDFQTAKETLYRVGLSYTLTRYNFGPILNSTINWLWNYRDNQPKSQSLSIPASVSQILPLGGEITGSFSADAVREEGGEPAADHDFRWGTDFQVNLRQPLLRGAGYEASHEALTQSQRSLVYAVRGFELFRQDFAIRVANQYYQLVRQKRQLANDEQNYKDAVYDREQAEALRKLDRNTPDAVFLARRREIDAETLLVGARTDYKLALDDFKILLGFPTSLSIELKDDEPPFEAVRVDPQSAVQVALANRLDLHTRRDQVDDVKRGVNIARNALLPQFDVVGSYRVASQTGQTTDATPSDRSGTFGASLEIPLDRKAERNVYRSSLIDLAQAQRDLAQFENEVERDILNAIRELKQFEKQIELQQDQVKDQHRAVAVTKIRVEAGEAQQRDLADARQSLNNAMNALIQLKVQHFIARLALRRNLGILFIDENGMWLP